MSEWGWVALGYGTTTVALIGYLVVLVRAASAVRRRERRTR